MKLIFTYDNTDLKNLDRITATDEQAVTEIHVLTVENGKKKHLYDVAVEIKKETAANAPSIIFIDQYLECADEGFEWLQRNAGIALVKFLRMLEVTNHFVLISPFEQYELIKLSPANLIVSSKGISFTKYLHEFSKKSLMEIDALALDTFDDKQKLKPYIMAEFSLPEDERHNWANWWGIDRLWNVHRVVEQKKYALTERWRLKEYPDPLKDKLKALKNQEALFLYGHQESHIVTALSELNENILKLTDSLERCLTGKNYYLEFQNNNQSSKEEKAALIKSLESQISLINRHLPYLNGRSETFKSKLAERMRKIVTLSAEIRELENNLMEARKETRKIRYRMSNEEKRLEDLNQELVKEEERYLSSIMGDIEKIETEIKGLQSKILSLSIPALRNKLKEKSPKILYIDDQANEGWSNIFQHIIYNEEQPDIDRHKLPGFFKVIQPKETDKIDANYFNTYVKSVIMEFNPALIMLDLRLNKESGIKIEVENLSGAIMLKEIREQFPGIPVLMTTASNKSWSYEELQRIGCDAFWTKEGIDTGMTEHDSVKNYMRFAELVNILSAGEFKFLAKYASAISKLKIKGSHWWLNPKWCNDATDHYKESVQVDKDVVFDILDDAHLIFRSYLRKEFVQLDFGNKLNQWMYPSLIIQHLAKIIEHIHGVTQTGIPSTEYIKNTRGDKDAGELLKERGFASHYNDAKTINYNTATGFIEKLLNYLNDKPEFYVGPKVIGKISL